MSPINRRTDATETGNGTETSPARRAGVSLGVARKKTKPGLDGAGGRYVPTSTSRACAGGGGASDSSAPSAAPSTSSLRWLATATSGAGGGAALSGRNTACGGGGMQRVLVGAGSRSEAKSGENTGEAMGEKKRPGSRARRRVWFTREQRLIQTGAIFSRSVRVVCATAAKTRRRACVRAARQRPLVCGLRIRYRSRARAGVRPSGDSTRQAWLRQRWPSPPRQLRSPPARARPRRLPWLFAVPVRVTPITRLSHHHEVICSEWNPILHFYSAVPQPKLCCHRTPCSDRRRRGRGGAWRREAAPRRRRRRARTIPRPRKRR